MSRYPYAQQVPKGLVAALLAVTGVLMVSGPAQAAAVHAEAGEVFINPGSGFIPVTTTTYVAAGTTIMVPAGATAYLAYEGGCTTRIEGPRTVAVAAVPPCQPGQGQATADWAAQTSPTGQAVDALSTPVVIGGLVVAGGVGAALALSGGGNDKAPLSP